MEVTEVETSGGKRNKVSCCRGMNDNTQGDTAGTIGDTGSTVDTATTSSGISTGTDSDCPCSCSWVSTLLAGLLTSSCCAIQLFLNFLSSLNILHVGCAGFNKVLGPLRPLLRGVTLLLMGRLWYLHFSFPPSKKLGNGMNKPSVICDRKASSSSSTSRLLAQSLVCLVLMFSPELLRAMSPIGSVQLSDDMVSSPGGKWSSMFSTIPVDTTKPTAAGVMWKHYIVHNMGCEACVTHVQNVVQNADGVIQTNDLVFDDGLLSVLVHRDGCFDEVSLKNILVVDGYDLESVSVDSYQNLASIESHVEGGIGGDAYAEL
jgi:hypothetical protein